jgi:hypothetical protein
MTGHVGRDGERLMEVQIHCRPMRQQESCAPGSRQAQTEAAKRVRSSFASQNAEDAR